MRQLGATLFAVVTVAVLTAAANITGNWAVDVDFDDTSLAGGGIDCAFKQEGEQLTGNCMGVAVTGDVKEQAVTWHFQGKADGPESRFTGTVNEAGTNITGTFSFNGKSGRFTASKQR